MLNLFKKDFNLLFDEYMKHSDEPFQFLSCLFALEDFYHNEDCIIKMPILFDISCNGIQHLSSLTREATLAEQVNVIPDTNDPDKFGDVYAYSADLINNVLEKSVISNKIELINLVKDDIEVSQLKDIIKSENFNWSKIRINVLRNFKFSRSLIKMPVMTLSYNVSLTGITEQLENLIPKT
jgi:DNA-directed RNA polymerase